jgi:hypothetical protein
VISAPSPSRRLSTHQKAVLIQVLLAFPEQHVGIWSSPTADDAGAYAEDFATVFKAIGWSVSPSDMTQVLDVRFSGLALVSSAESGLSGCGEALRDALRIYQLELATLTGSSGLVPREGFVFAVGGVEPAA